MYVFYVPGEHEVHHSIEHHHKQHHEQVVLVALHRRDVDVVPLHPNALYLIKRKVLGAKSKGRGREQWLQSEHTKFYLLAIKIFWWFLILWWQKGGEFFSTFMISGSTESYIDWWMFVYIQEPAFWCYVKTIISPNFVWHHWTLLQTMFFGCFHRSKFLHVLNVSTFIHRYL